MADIQHTFVNDGETSMDGLEEEVVVQVVLQRGDDNEAKYEEPTSVFEEYEPTETEDPTPRQPINYHEKFGIPGASWKRKLSESNTDAPQFQVPWAQIVKLMPLGLRMQRYVKSVRKENREPFMDPFITKSTSSDKGVPCGGIGCGSICRSWSGNFNNFLLKPGRPTVNNVKADQFSLYVKREGFHSKAVVLGGSKGLSRRKTEQKEKEDNANSNIIDMPPAEPLPQDIASLLDGLNIEEPNEVEPEGPGVPEAAKPASQTPTEATNANTKKKTTKIKKVYIKPEAALENWRWRAPNGEYFGLFPRAWTVYDVSKIDKKLSVSCKQLSPVIPHNYKESSYPVCLFIWDLENTHPRRSVEVSLMFTFQNGNGELSDYTGGHFNKPFKSNKQENPNTVGVELVNNNKNFCWEDNQSVEYADPLSFGIATKKAERFENGETKEIESEMSYATTFQTTGRGDQIWTSFSLTGKAIVPEKSASQSIEGIGIGAAVANKVTIPPKTTVQVIFALGWDQPIVRFGEGRGVHPRYTRFYGTSGNAVENICFDALKAWRNWDEQITLWQEPILNNPDIPDWYKNGLFNQLYYIVSGGSLWIDKEESAVSRLAHRVSKTTTSLSRSGTNASTGSAIKSASKGKVNKKDQDKEYTEKLIADFIEFTDEIGQGVMIYRPDATTGKIIFSIDEIEENVAYTTKHGNSIERNADGTALLGNSVVVTKNPTIDPQQQQPQSEQSSEQNESSPPTEDTQDGAQQPKPPIPGSESERKQEQPEPESTTETPFDINEYGLYLYLEGQEYLMYNTYDVHFYASFALILLWPELELNIQRNIAKSTLLHEPNDKRITLHSGEVRPKKLRGAVPHDVGTPGEDPVYKVNSYCIHDVNHWKDLNTKFTLQIYRDFIATNNIEFLKDCYPIVWESMHYLERYLPPSPFPSQIFNANFFFLFKKKKKIRFE